MADNDAIDRWDANNGFNVPVAGNMWRNPFWRNAALLGTAAMFGRRRMQPQNWVANIKAKLAARSSKRGRRGRTQATVKNTQGGGLVQARPLTKKRRGRKRVGKLKRLQKTVSSIKRIIPKRSTFTYRWLSTGTVVAAQNERQHAMPADLSAPGFKSAVQQGLPFFNPETGAFKISDVSANTAWSDLRIDVKHRLQCRNNTNQPLEMWIYQFNYIEDSSSTPLSLFEAYWDNAIGVVPTTGGGIPGMNNPPLPFDRFPSDSKASWKHDLKMVFHQHVILNPGNTFEKWTIKRNVKYDPNYLNDHGATYLKGLKCFAYYVMIQGLIAHDSTVPTLVGYADTQLDYIQNIEYKIHYITDLPIVHHSDHTANLSAMPTGAVEGGVSTAAVVQDE